MPLTNKALASCGATGCPVDVPGVKTLGAGEARLSLLAEYVHQDQALAGRKRVATGHVSGHHDEQETLNEIKTFDLSIGLSDRMSVQVEVPFIHREHTHVHNHHGVPQPPDRWDFNGMGDVRVGLRRDILRMGNERPFTAELLGKVEFPTGRDNAKNHDGMDAEPGILPSDNAYAFITGFAIRKDLSAPTINGLYGRMPLFLSTTYQWNEPGIDDYRLGNVWLLNVGTAYPLLPRLSALLQTNLKVARRDDRGKTHEEVEKTGGTFVYVSPGFELGFSEALSSFILVQIPVYQRVNVVQLVSDWNLAAGVSYRFSLVQ